MLVAPTALAGEVLSGATGCASLRRRRTERFASAMSLNAAPIPDLHWWASLCDLVRKRTRLAVVLVDAPHRGLDPGAVLALARKRRKTAALGGMTPGERSALLDIARAVCTGSRELLAEAQLLAAPHFQPSAVHAAIRTGALADPLAARRVNGLPATA